MVEIITGVVVVTLVTTKLAEAVIAETVRRISEILVTHAAALASVKGKVENLRDELRRIQCFLEDAESAHKDEKRVQNWLVEVKGVACEIEDAVETYAYHAKASPGDSRRLKELHTTIVSVEEKLKKIGEGRKNYQIKLEPKPAGEGSSSSMRSLRWTHPYDEDRHVVGFEAHAAVAKEMLTREEDGMSFVSVVGMPGSGKTTLAKKVYGDDAVKRHFDCCAWAFVSHRHDKTEILTEILMQVGFREVPEEPKKKKKLSRKVSSLPRNCFSPEDASDSGGNEFTRENLEDRRNRRKILKSLNDKELESLVRSELRDKRYLVVLDDIWSDGAWSSVKAAFPEGKRGSKVVFTARNKDVMVSIGADKSMIEPSLLTTAECWEILRPKAFPGESFTTIESPLEFERLGKDMVESRCGRLPLAVAVLGGLLRTTPTLSGWKSQLRKLLPGVNNILELSYEDLPYYLKPCFLYMATFPEDSEIPKKRLIRLWISEGFIPDTRREDVDGETTMEDLAEHFLEELVNRCMVQVLRRNHTRKGVKTCRLHNLMREICISKSKDEHFFRIVAQHNNEVCFRIVAYHGTACTDTSWMEKLIHPQLRSLLVSGTDLNTLKPLKKLSLTMLRVLEIDLFSDKSAKNKKERSKIPVEIGSLILLRYLRFSGASTLKLPRSLKKLINLETLDLQGNERVLLPRKMSQLNRLKHLSLPRQYSYAHWFQRGFGVFRSLPLTNIETLKGIHASDLIKASASTSLANIRVLGIEFKRRREYDALVKSLSHDLVRLRTCSLKMYRFEFPNLKLLSQCKTLTSLRISGELSPENFSALPKTLSKLELSHFVLSKDNLVIMEKLPSLRILRLSHSPPSNWYEYSETELVFSSNGFPKLEILSLDSLSRVEQWEVERGAMPNLERLDITSMTELCVIPEGLKHIRNLRELRISKMRRAFEDRVKRVNGDGIRGGDYYKVSHVPFISTSVTLKDSDDLSESKHSFDFNGPSERQPLRRSS